MFIKSYYFIVCVYEKIFAGLFHFFVQGTETFVLVANNNTIC